MQNLENYMMKMNSSSNNNMKYYIAGGVVLVVIILIIVLSSGSEVQFMIDTDRYSEDSKNWGGVYKVIGTHNGRPVYENEHKGKIKYEVNDSNAEPSEFGNNYMAINHLRDNGWTFAKDGHHRLGVIDNTDSMLPPFNIQWVIRPMRDEHEVQGTYFHASKTISKPPDEFRYIRLGSSSNNVNYSLCRTESCFGDRETENGNRGEGVDSQEECNLVAKAFGRDGCKLQSDRRTFGGGRFRFWNGDSGCIPKGESRDVVFGKKKVRFTNMSRYKDSCN